jgi:hypothetical protein
MYSNHLIYSNLINTLINFLKWKQKLKKKKEYILNIKNVIYKSHEKKINLFNLIILFILLKRLKEECRIL